jgi:hypothetical protein
LDSDEDSYCSIDESTHRQYSPPSSDDDSFSLDSFSIDTTPDFNIDDESLSDILSCVDSFNLELEEDVIKADTSVPPLKQSNGGHHGASTDNLQNLQDMKFLFDATSTFKNERWDHERLYWDAHEQYLMSVPTHGKLVWILDPILKRNECNSRCSGPILIEYIVAAGIRYLSGDRQKDILHIIGCSPRAAYHAVGDFIDDVNTSPELDIHLPKSSEEWLAINAEWKKKAQMKSLQNVLEH